LNVPFYPINFLTAGFLRQGRERPFPIRAVDHSDGARNWLGSIRVHPRLLAHACVGWCPGSRLAGKIGISDRFSGARISQRRPLATIWAIPCRSWRPETVRTGPYDIFYTYPEHTPTSMTA